MLLEDLPTEILTNVFTRSPTVPSALALASTCRRLHSIFKSSKKLVILQEAAERQYGPLHDAIQLVTHNASQPAHMVRPVPISETLLRSIVQAGKVAVQWEEIYPFKKWKTDFADRRLLDDEERVVFRRALYRLWLFSRAYHNREHPRLLRASPQAMMERAMLLHNFNTGELAEMLDVHNMLRDTISNNVCPSNGTIRRKFEKRFPGSGHQLLFNIHLNYPLTNGYSNFASSDEYYIYGSPRVAESKYHSKFVPSRTHEPGAEGWGDDVLHYYVVEDMLKLDPAQILHLRNEAPLKDQVESYVRELGEWFDNNGETFCQTMAHVVVQRGGEMEEIREAVLDGMLGVAVGDAE
ncbi:F-box domain protein [Myriangium duriaei CBS 260.36]|uniref:F-box domain protein n=1 Tax=Myriangium duriaei CBS 260.36 TaxID=1168546 RepID=A0A9P4JA93_9PEZI|nr:F-box domain protein [Myriangium duriaei CBS 260.36]